MPSQRADLKSKAASLTGTSAGELFFDWATWARSDQLPPDGDWTTWLLIGGRGSGKTRAGAEWVRALAADGVTPIALVGETMTEAIAVMVKGESGLLGIYPQKERPVLKGTSVIWPNGVEAIAMSASDPDRFRGPQFAAAWCDELEVLAGENAGAKGMPQPEEEDEIAASFAVAFCEGEVHRLGRIWADGQLLETDGLVLRFYRGGEGQLPDSLIEASQGDAPAYRGLCYLVVERLPLSRFGNRIPQLSVELCQVVGELEPAIRAVTVIPGATEFGYDPVPRLRVLGPGRTESENAHMAAGISDWSWSIDELTALCPNLERVALVVSWFGSDLRCGSCTIGPRVEAADRQVNGTNWSVAGLGRGDVPVVSQHGGGPAYGGTPSDASVLAAIADLTARGIEVAIYPIVMMDIPAGNALPDPHTGASGQPAYPWRGRITCHPAPGRAGSPDATSAVNAQVTAFANAGYRAMILHYAGIAASAGAKTVLVGSEMVGMTTLRGAANSFPFVDVLVSLAAQVRVIVGSTTKITYAADWSEYSGHQPGGQKFFHLDPLWASPNVDAVGIDNYMPLADWRDGQEHEDKALAETGYELDYLMGNVAGGEGYDWYYASDADRAALVRTPISDGTYGEPWVWRIKDIPNWWSQWHHDRPGGVRKSTPTAWVPGSKPIYFTETGCGAVDKGANQPNIFGDDKSAESGRPYFSSGVADPLMQRQVLRAQHRYWSQPGNNPPGMLDLSRIYHWTWDARPFPAFPGRDDVWWDGENHRVGHWLTGRLGALASDELAIAVAGAHGVTLTAEPALPLVQGYVLGDVTSGRAALEPLTAASGQSLRDGAEGLSLGQARRGSAVTVSADDLVAEDRAVLSRRRADPEEVAGRLALSFIDRERDYLAGTVTALRGTGQLASEALPLVLDASGARIAAERALTARGPGRETLEFALPPGELVLEPGDVVQIDGLDEGPFEITEIRDGASRRVVARSMHESFAVIAEDGPRATSAGVPVRSMPILAAAHLPSEPGGSATRLVIGAFAQPWPGNVAVTDASTGAVLTRLSRNAVMGEVVGAFGSGPAEVWDEASRPLIKLYAGHLAGMDEIAVLAGANRLAVETDSGDWEIVGFAEAELAAPSTYRLSRLLRGQGGTQAAIGLVSVGRRVLVLDTRVVTLPVDVAGLGGTRELRVFAGSSDLTGLVASVDLDTGPALPLGSVHLRAVRIAGGDILLDWVRRSRDDSDGWGTADAPLEHLPERYRLQIFDGAVLRRSVDCSTPLASYTAAEQVADFGSLPGAFDFSVAQVSQVFGPGPVAKGEFHG